MTNTQSSPPARRRPEPHDVTVSRVEHVSPLMLRVTFSSDSLASFGPPLPASHLKLFFETDDGTVARTYTPLRFDPEAGELDVEFVLHGDGPAADWAASAAVGQPLRLAGPGRGYAIHDDADWYLMVVDQTALPAAATILRDLPAGMPVTVIAEVADEAEQREFPTDASVTWVWLPRNGRPVGEDAAFLNALSAFEPGAGNGVAYAGTEASVVRRVRRYLIDELRLEADNVVARGYWRNGASNHPDGDYATD